MITTISDRLARGRLDENGLQVRTRPRTVALVALGVAVLLVLTGALATIWHSYRPYRGC